MRLKGGKSWTKGGGRIEQGGVLQAQTDGVINQVAVELVMSPALV